MKIFEPHAHMFSRTTDDYQAMALAGVRGILEPAFWLGQPRTHVATFKDYYDTLLGWERFRAAQFGIRHYCTMALNPKEANDPRLRQEVIALVRDYVDREGVLGVGEIGYDDMTPAEEEAFAAQLEIAKDKSLPVLIHTPHRDKKQGTIRTLDLVRESGIDPELVLVDHNNEETTPLVKDTACWAGYSIYPNTKMDPDRMIEIFRRYGTEKMLINSACDWGISDPLSVPKTAMLMRKAAMDEEEIQRVVWNNPIDFFAQSGRISYADFGELPPGEKAALHEGNSVLRGPQR
ncbi:MAG: TatD family hydrolase [Planctomycetota bacterium]